MNERKVGKTECMNRRGGWWHLPVTAFVVGAALLPRYASAMAADGALITNIVSATYGGSGGPTIQYKVSYNATITVLVSCPVVSLAKVAIPTVQSAGAVVTFQIWVANTSMQASAFNVVINDRLPDNMTYLGPLTFTWFSGAPVVVTTNAANTATPPWIAGQPNAGQGSPYYLRWTIDKLGPTRSGYIQFLATVI